MRQGRSRSWSMQILHWLPEPLVAAPERIFLKFACILIGIGIVGGTWLRPDSPLAVLPRIIVVELGLAFIVGGSCAIIGIVRNHRGLERLGLAATAFASISYAAVLGIVLGWPEAVVSSVVFTGLAFASATRLIVSSAVTAVAVEVARYDP